MNRDFSRWAKKFDKYAHLYSGSKVACGKWGACLGNNYATTDMETCPDCLEAVEEKQNEDDNYKAHLYT
jgi:seryl-tRNA synthetase